MKKLTLILLIALFTCSLAAQTRETWTYEMTEVPIPVGMGEGEIDFRLGGGLYIGAYGFTIDYDQNIYIATHRGQIKKFNLKGQFICASPIGTDKQEIMGFANNYLYVYNNNNNNPKLTKYASNLNLLDSYEMSTNGSLQFALNNTNGFGFLSGFRLQLINIEDGIANFNETNYSDNYHVVFDQEILAPVLAVLGTNYTYNINTIWGTTWSINFYQEDKENNLYFLYCPGEDYTTQTGNPKFGIINYKSNTVIETNIEIESDEVPVEFSTWPIYVDKNGVIYQLYLPSENNVFIRLWNKIG